jgi:DNA-binding NtrC family response regulator
VRTRVLLVEPDAADAATLRHALAMAADVDACLDFSSARSQLFVHGYQLLVTNLRLRAYNGLHLVYLAQVASTPTRSVVYTNSREAALAREVQHAGAFYECRRRLTYALRGYVGAALPARDRRDPEITERRRVFRGGRRRSDLPMLVVS